MTKATGIEAMAMQIIRQNYPVDRAQAAVRRATENFHATARQPNTYIGGFEDGADFAFGMIYAALDAEQGADGALERLPSRDQSFIAATVLCAGDAQEREVERLKAMEANGECLGCGQHHGEHQFFGETPLTEAMAIFSAGVMELMDRLGITEFSFQPRESAGGRGLQLTGGPDVGATLTLVDKKTIDESLDAQSVH